MYVLIVIKKVFFDRPSTRTLLLFFDFYLFFLFYFLKTGQNLDVGSFPVIVASMPNFFL